MRTFTVLQADFQKLFTQNWLETGFSTLHYLQEKQFLLDSRMTFVIVNFTNFWNVSNLKIIRYVHHFCKTICKNVLFKIDLIENSTLYV